MLRGRTDALRADVLHADADDCEKERRKEKLTKYKSWRTDLYADTSHVRADADGGGEWKKKEKSQILAGWMRMRGGGCVVHAREENKEKKVSNAYTVI